ncbi:MarR family transcriptional regulator [Streptomyces sp. NBC_01643]|uniref:MarR family transcriptional regulator n=1 Tax=Streptomyces sp. NBC_01643 TaxID=2975906 RepID=UPI00386F1061|nr:MarR family transcriptional regulator [Streptomyces sp. NBC_01643]
MVTPNFSVALPAPASSRPYPMAKPGYGKRSAPDQLPSRTDDFTMLPARERYVAAFIERLPEGAAMNVKSLAKQLPLYGQQAVSSALTALSVAGHLRRVRRRVGEGDQVRWVFRTFWSRTARDNEWWATHLAAETSQASAATTEASDMPPPPWVPAATPAGGPEPAPAPRDVPQPAPPASTDTPAEASAPTTPLQPTLIQAPVPQQPDAPLPQTHPAPDFPRTRKHPTPAYLALAQLGRTEPRLALSNADCQALEEQANDWLARGVTPDYLIRVLAGGLPGEAITSPRGFVRHRLKEKEPPHLATTTPATPSRRVMMECTQCGVPGRPEALPDGLCRGCRQPAQGTDTAPEPSTGQGATIIANRDVHSFVDRLRDMIKAP